MGPDRKPPRGEVLHAHQERREGAGEGSRRNGAVSPASSTSCCSSRSHGGAAAVSAANRGHAFVLAAPKTTWRGRWRRTSRCSKSSFATRACRPTRRGWRRGAPSAASSRRKNISAMRGRSAGSRDLRAGPGVRRAQLRAQSRIHRGRGDHARAWHRRGHHDLRRAAMPSASPAAVCRSRSPRARLRVPAAARCRGRAAARASIRPEPARRRPAGVNAVPCRSLDTALDGDDCGRYPGAHQLAAVSRPRSFR